jgi:hypothetical protein
MIVDRILNKISDFILSLEEFTNIWIFHAVEDFRQEDLASVLPPEKSTSENEAQRHPPEAQPSEEVTPAPPSSEASVQTKSVQQASRREKNLWWLCTVVFMVSLIIYVLFFAPH